MAILDKIRKPKAAVTTEDTKAKRAPAKKAKSADEGAVASKATQGNALSSRLLRAPRVSEKAARLAEKGTYVFEVAQDAEKISIKRAVESLYGIKVASVRIINVGGKPVKKGRRVSYRSDLKKALVTVKPGQKIDLYEGV
ncbi:MAG: 50S ribosomal protein L23 [Candidatus Magasanikbacteria bacterium]|nr:50S ribosomal protein L23 [Candidatus Magasanikbacteria bacterium]MCA9391044.1 50S ribosomal protein L23 [Candidatus Magasanikbacteria bacterium]USN52592.1 MAG: 50S ribosomal protein L23 [Candidatus Nomurabacteria bacterium]